MSFSFFSKAIRRTLNLSQEQLAKDLNVSFATINRWENGHAEPSNRAKMQFIQYCQEHKIKENKIDQLVKRSIQSKANQSHPKKEWGESL